MDPNTPAPTPQPMQPQTPSNPQPEPTQPVTEPQPYVPQAPTEVAVQPMAQAPIDPYLPPMPQVTEQPMGPRTHLKDPGHGFGIAALVTSVIGLGLLGVIFGIIALKKSKNAGFNTNILGLIGLILGSISMLVIVPLIVLTLSSFQGAQTKGRDVQAKNRVNAVHSKLEEYFNVNSAYPKTISTTNLAGIDASALNDPTGEPISVADGTAKDIRDALEMDLPTASARYQYIPFDCGDMYCLGYVLRIYIEKTDSRTNNPYVKTGLNNP